MEKLQFRTNINCSGCVAAVTPRLEGREGIIDWKVDTVNPQKILTVETNKLTNEDIIKWVGEAGFKAEAISNGK